MTHTLSTTLHDGKLKRELLYDPIFNGESDIKDIQVFQEIRDKFPDESLQAEAKKMENPQYKPAPLVVMMEGPCLWLISGYTTLRAARLAGRWTLPQHVFSGDEQEARELAFTINDI